MNSQERNRSELGGIILFIGAAIVLGIYIAVRNFSMTIGVPTDVGGSVLLRSGAAIVIAAIAGRFFQFHRHWIGIPVLMLLAGLSIAFWPALDIWAAEPGLTLSFAEDPEVTMKWWGSTATRIIVFAGLLGGAFWLAVKD